MAATPWRILVVDDEIDICEQIRDFLQGEILPDSDTVCEVEIRNDLIGGMSALETQRFDLGILDVRLGLADEELSAGKRLLDEIKKVRFLPVVFYTGLPHVVVDDRTALVRVVEKTAGLPALLEAITSIFATHLPAINRALIRHLESVQREYMWTFVANHWDLFDNNQGRADLAYYLARRLSASLSGEAMQQFIQELGMPVSEFVTGEQIHPMQYYLYPPIRMAPPLAGDLFSGSIGGVEGFWVLLTPSCDMVVRGNGSPKSEFVLFAKCIPLEELEEYKAITPPPVQGQDNGQKGRVAKLKSLMANRREGGQAERYFFLPGALALPDCVVDFQQLSSIPWQQLVSLKRLASLDSPFAEALLTKYIRFFGRLGTPDLNTDLLMQRLYPST